MNELLKILNQCSPERTVFYCVTALVTLLIIVFGLCEIATLFKKK